MQYRLILQEWDAEGKHFIDRTIVLGSTRTIIAGAEDVIDNLLEDGFTPIKTYEEAKEYIDRVYKRTDRRRATKSGESS